MNYKYRELEYAKKIYEEGFQSKYIPTELRLVVLYMKTFLGYKPKELKEKTYEFCIKNIPGYNRVKYYKVINKAINYAINNKNKLITIKQVDIFDYEINYINDLLIHESDGVIPSYVYECKKVLFAILCIIKINTQISEIKNGKKSKGLYFQGGKKKYNDLSKMAKINSKLKINEDIIHTLSECKIVTPLHGGLIRLNFIESISKIDKSGDNKVVLEVENFDNCGWYFDYYNKLKKMKLCRFCNQPFKQTKHDILYCNEHKQYYTKLDVKTIKCIDCGEEFEVDGVVKKQERCQSCYKIYRNNYQKELMRIRRSNC
jgi:predicted Zn-ribbon and HTH transcriptional regulator